MSDNWLRYAPRDPHFRPEAAAAESATALVRQFLPQAEEVISEYFEHVTFIDPGTNWSGASCPSCGAEVSDWWGEGMNHFQEHRTLLVEAGCCGATVNLNELKYARPSAFASFVIEAMNPNVPKLPAEKIAELGERLGCEVVEIPQHI